MGAVRHKLVALAVATTMWAGVVVAFNAHAWDSSPLNPVTITRPAQYDCGADDRPESMDVHVGPDGKDVKTPRPWVQGDVSSADQQSGRAQLGFNCGLELVGYTPLAGTVPDQDGQPFTRVNVNANMAWIGSCAYVSGPIGSNPMVPSYLAAPPSGGGVAVVDVHNPNKPAFVRVLRSPGSLATSETIGAVTTTSGRSILVVGQYGTNAVVPPPGQPMDIYDATDDCTHPVLKGTYYWPKNIHNLTISHDGRFVFATIPAQVLDISPLWDEDPTTGPRYVADLEDYIYGLPVNPGPSADYTNGAPLPTHPVTTSHEAWLSEDDSTVYIGAQTVEGNLFTIMHVGDWLQWIKDHPGQDPAQNATAPKPTVVHQWAGRGHSIRLANINGTPYILHSEESPFGAGYSCAPQEGNPFVGPSQPWLTDISDPTNPKYVTEMGLEINDPQNCPEQLQAREDNSVHYHDVDDPDHTTFVMASMWNSGIRVFDVRRPQAPTEVAYFNPGDLDPSSTVALDHTWGHVHYDSVNHNIWFASANGGFWVVKVEHQILQDLGMTRANGSVPAAASLNAPERGWPGTAGVHVPPQAAGYVDISPYYCILGTNSVSYRPVG